MGENIDKATNYRISIHHKVDDLIRGTMCLCQFFATLIAVLIEKILFLVKF